MTNAPPPDFSSLLVPDITVEESNKNILEATQEMAEDFWPSLKRAFPDWRLPGSVKLSDEDRLNKYLLAIFSGPPPTQQPVLDPMGTPVVDPMTMQPQMQEVPWSKTMPVTDEQGYEVIGLDGQPVMEQRPWEPTDAAQELMLLLDEDYGELVKAGIAPPPQTRPWATLVRLGPATRGSPWWDLTHDLRRLWNARNEGKGAWANAESV